MRKLILVLATTAVALAAAAGTAGAKPAASGTIVDVAAGTKSLSTLASLVKTAGLGGALSAPDASLTVFAPTNAAFARLEAAVPGVTAALTARANRKLLVQVLRYHVLASEVRAKDAVAAARKGSSVPTLLGKNANGRLALALAGGKVKIADSAGIDTATVTRTDVAASNGVVHVVDRVLVPTSIATALAKAGLLG